MFKSPKDETLNSKIGGKLSSEKQIGREEQNTTWTPPKASGTQQPAAPPHAPLSSSYNHTNLKNPKG
jgi:hypothetical protein